MSKLVLAAFLFLGLLFCSAQSEERTCTLLIWNKLEKSVRYAVYKETGSQCCDILIAGGKIGRGEVEMFSEKLAEGDYFCVASTGSGKAILYFTVDLEDLKKCRQANEGEGDVLLLELEEEDFD